MSAREQFHLTEFADLHAGDIIRRRMHNGKIVENFAYMDHVILGFNTAGDIKIARAYAFASGVGTTGPTALLGCETYIISADDYTAIFYGTTERIWILVAHSFLT